MVDFTEEELKLIHIIFMNTRWTTAEAEMAVIGKEIMKKIELQKIEETDK